MHLGYDRGAATGKDAVHQGNPLRAGDDVIEEERPSNTVVLAVGSRKKRANALEVEKLSSALT